MDNNLIFNNDGVKAPKISKICNKKIKLDFSIGNWTSNVSGDDNLIPTEYRGSVGSFNLWTLFYGVQTSHLSNYNKLGGWGPNGCGKYENESHRTYGCAIACTFKVPAIITGIRWSKHGGFSRYGWSAGNNSPTGVCTVVFRSTNLGDPLQISTSGKQLDIKFPDYPIYGVAVRFMSNGHSYSDEVGVKNAYLIGKKLVDNSKPDSGTIIEDISCSL
jgi:hypothetical protein